MGFFSKVARSVKKFIKDPKRIATAIATMGVSESARTAGKAVTDAIVPDMPDIPGPDPNKPNQVMPEADMEELAKQRKRRIAEMRQRSGRASTILSDNSSDTLG